VKFDFPLARTSRGIFRDVDHTCGAAYAETCSRRRYRHIAGFCRKAGNERDRTARDVEHGSIALASFLIDEFINDNPRVSGEAQSRLIVEANAERRVGAGLQDVIFIDSVTYFERGRRRVSAPYRRDALQCCDLPNLVLRLLICTGLSLRTSGQRP